MDEMNTWISISSSLKDWKPSNLAIPLKWKKKANLYHSIYLIIKFQFGIENHTKAPILSINIRG